MSHPTTNRRPATRWLVGICTLVVLALPSAARAQPKLDIKVFAGFNSTTFIELLETERLRETLFGWQVGFGARIQKNRWFGEVLVSFNRWALRFSDDELRLKGRANSFELPLIGGYVPYKNPYFKLFLYAGYVNHFNTRLVVKVSDMEGDSVKLKFRPKEVGLAIYQALARFGVSFDLAMFNFDFNYSISMNSAGTDTYRTSYHQLQANIAYLF